MTRLLIGMALCGAAYGMMWRSGGTPVAAAPAGVRADVPWQPDGAGIQSGRDIADEARRQLDQGLEDLDRATAVRIHDADGERVVTSPEELERMRARGRALLEAMRGRVGLGEAAGVRSGPSFEPGKPMIDPTPPPIRPATGR
ncbi:MAG TPA: hypothetical protein VF727_04405 [Allosphingosinicella sp.]|jgi:hypothetical protein